MRMTNSKRKCLHVTGSLQPGGAGANCVVSRLLFLNGKYCFRCEIFILHPLQAILNVNWSTLCVAAHFNLKNVESHLSYSMCCNPVFQTQEEMLRDRIRSIDHLEHRYDALQVEKRQVRSRTNEWKRDR